MFIEAKYQAELSWKTSNSGGQKKYPGDQLIRNIRVGLHHCGYFAGKGLFDTVPRDFVAILLAPRTENALVRRYRREDKLRRAIPYSERLAALPRQQTNSVATAALPGITRPACVGIALVAGKST